MQKSLYDCRCKIILENMILVILSMFLPDINLSIICDVYKKLWTIQREAQ